MSTYVLNKMIREINRDAAKREAYFNSSSEFAAGYHPLTEEEREAFVALDYGKLYKLGVHGLILRPFSLIHKVPEPAYLGAIRS
jgi:hypothetical protein